MLKLLPLLFLSFLSVAHASGPVGYYRDGSLENGVNLPVSGEGYMRLFLEHDRGWGAVELINLITASAWQMSRAYPGEARLQVEDLSARFGGKITDHGSHQNGLDADLTYYRIDNLEHEPSRSYQMYSPPMVVNGLISPNFHSEKNWALVKSLHQNGNVNRIFMDQVIKNELCRYARSVGEDQSYSEVLRSLRHEENHQDHLHVRLHCPPGASKCRPQAPPPAGSGCP